MDTLIIGCGYLGRRIADLLLTRGDKLYALTRSTHRANAMQADRINPIVGDIMVPDSLELPRVDRVIYAVGFDRTADFSKRDVYVTGLANVLAKLSENTPVTYVSSTSVYGQSNGEWIDEDSSTEPKSDGGKVCLEAEQLLKREQSGASIVRLAGIYGPGRVLRNVRSMQAGEALPGNPDSFLNLIHVDDASQLVLASIESGESMILGCDGQPSTRQAFYSQLAALVDAPEPKFDPDLPTRSAAGGIGKRCRSRIVPTLDELSFRYPTFVEGLKHAVEAQR